MTFLDELSEIADELDKLSAKLSPKEATLLNIKDKAELVGKSSSNSWIGYQASVYYNNFQAPPSGAVFSIQWGLGGGIPNLAYVRRVTGKDIIQVM